MLAYEAAEVFAVEDADAEFEELPTDSVEVAEPLSPDSEASDAPEPHYGLTINDVIAVKIGGKERIGRVFGLDDRVDRASVEWEGLRGDEERFESLNLAGEDWWQLKRSNRLRGIPTDPALERAVRCLLPDPALMANMPGECGGVREASGGSADTSDGTARVLAAIAALEAKFSSAAGGGAATGETADPSSTTEHTDDLNRSHFALARREAS